MDSGQAADRINADSIHVLVNMNGYTKGARNEIFALRPAPVQVMWLGYPGTSGASYMDYIVTDKITSPVAVADQYSEKLAYMPHTFFVGDHRYMFPHLLLSGQGTTNPDAIRSIDSQAGVIVIKGVIQKPAHPVATPLKTSADQQQQLLVLQQHSVLAPHQQQTSPALLGLQQQTSPALLSLQQQTSPALLGLQQQQLLRQTSLGLQQQTSPALLSLQQQTSPALLGLQQQTSPYFPSSQLVSLQLQGQVAGQVVAGARHQFSKQQGLAVPALALPTTPPEESYGPPRDLPLTTRVQYSLPEDTIVFCNFNQLYKIDPDTLQCWIGILKRVANSVLWLLRFPAAGEPNVIAMASKLGLPPGRIVFSPVAPKEEHVRRGRLADLCLDTPLCNGHTTGMDVLWAGTPVLTLPLQSLASRVAASQLHALGFPELVASSYEDYEEKAVQLGNNPHE